ncbi:hypothetical protein G6F22_011464 [Rhizopus arrhizus]|nr:hypothetical protein G6F22_011464 [Rhizopus arrhizus]
MVRGGDAGDAGKPGAAQAKLARMPVHAIEECGLRSVQMARDRQCSVVAGDDHQAFQQACQSNFFARHQAHARFVIGHRMHIVAGNSDRFVPCAPAFFDACIRGVGGHQLGQ